MDRLVDRMSHGSAVSVSDPEVVHDEVSLFQQIAMACLDQCAPGTVARTRPRAPHGVDVQSVENPRNRHGLGSIVAFEQGGAAPGARRLPTGPVGCLVMAENLLASAHSDLLHLEVLSWFSSC
ncbi:MAG: hypothetical protein WAL61_17405 [Acidimicrobiales bacterium]